VPNWYKRQLSDKDKKQILKSRYSFSIEGDIFVDEEENKELEKYNAEESLIGKLPIQDGVRINNYNITPYKSI